MKTHILIISILIFVLSSCRQAPKSDGKFSGKDGEVKIIQLDPTHGHAATAQNEQIDEINTNVYVYAPDRNELEAYFEQIKSFNSRENNPTKWNEVVYIGKDFLEKMVQEKRGNVVVLAGNNRIKIDYIEQAIKAGMNVFSDKPMVIDKAGFERLKTAYAMAEQKGILMFDMMTERYSLLHNVQKSLMMDSLFFGKIQTGTPDHPAIFESSVHHYYRGGKGNRPSWFFDVSQQGEGIVDVTNHLIDLTFWKTFPDEIIDYTKDVKVLSAKHWPVNITRNEFSTATSLSEIPASLKPFMKDTILEVFANGSINYQVKGINMGVSVEWRAATPKDGNDLRYASAEGTKARLLIKQEYGQKRPLLYAQKGPDISEKDFQMQLEQAVSRLQKNYPGISLSKESESTEIVIPSDLELSHDPTFKVFLGYLVKRDMPEWEVPNTLAKYYITTTALEMTKGKK